MENQNKQNLKQNKKKFFEFSKLVVLFSSIIFCYSLYRGINVDLENMVDVSIYATAITVTGGIFGSSIIWYMKKSTHENVYKVKSSMYENLMRLRLDYVREILKLKTEYGVTDEDVQEIENQSELGEMSEKELSNMSGYLDEVENEATSTNDIQTF